MEAPSRPVGRGRAKLIKSVNGNPPGTKEANNNKVEAKEVRNPKPADGGEYVEF